MKEDNDENGFNLKRFIIAVIVVVAFVILAKYFL